MTDRLNSVGVEINAFFLTDRTDLGNRLNCADLVVGIHYRDKTGVVPESFFELVKADISVLVNIKVGHLEALFFELHKSVEHRMMFKCR